MSDERFIGSESDDIIAESEVEARIVASPRWVRGAAWGRARPGHPEGVIRRHIGDVLTNIDSLGAEPVQRAKLRLVALVHDTFKNEIDHNRPKSGDNHHAVVARKFLEHYTNDEDVLELTELHDEAFNAWAIGQRRGDWSQADARAAKLIERLGPRLALYIAFFRADNTVAGKSGEPLAWFESRWTEQRA